MAELLRDQDDLVLKLSTTEKFEGIHGDLRVPMSAVDQVIVLDDVIHAVRGLKVIGSSLPGFFKMGTFASGSETTFAIVHHQHKRGLRVHLRSGPFTTWIIGLDHPETVLASLGL
jgi:hypothetical protein